MTSLDSRYDILTIMMNLSIDDHRTGLDKLGEEPDDARPLISILGLRKVYIEKMLPLLFLKLFFDAKADENSKDIFGSLSLTNKLGSLKH